MVTKAEILQAARKRIALRQNSYICCAIDNVDIGTAWQRASLKKWIERQLQGSMCYDNWLIRRHPNFKRPRGYRTNRAGRLQWLDWMIAEVGESS